MEASLEGRYEPRQPRRRRQGFILARQQLRKEGRRAAALEELGGSRDEPGRRCDDLAPRDGRAKGPQQVPLERHLGGVLRTFGQTHVRQVTRRHRSAERGEHGDAGAGAEPVPVRRVAIPRHFPHRLELRLECLQDAQAIRGEQLSHRQGAPASEEVGPRFADLATRARGERELPDCPIHVHEVGREPEERLRLLADVGQAEGPLLVVARVNPRVLDLHVELEPVKEGLDGVQRRIGMIVELGTC